MLDPTDRELVPRTVDLVPIGSKVGAQGLNDTTAGLKAQFGVNCIMGFPAVLGSGYERSG
jgi:hypothetical protein